MIDIIFATLDARMTIINTTKISEATHTHTHTCSTSIPLSLADSNTYPLLYLSFHTSISCKRLSSSLWYFTRNFFDPSAFLIFLSLYSYLSQPILSYAPPPAHTYVRSHIISISMSSDLLMHPSTSLAALSDLWHGPSCWLGGLSTVRSCRYVQTSTAILHS